MERLKTMVAKEFIELRAIDIKNYYENLHISPNLLKYPYIGISGMGREETGRKLRKFHITWKHRQVNPGGGRYIDSIKMNGITIIDITYDIFLTGVLHVESVLKYDHTPNMFHQKDSYRYVRS